MVHGIIVFGAPGAGTSTVGRTLANELGFAHIETDDISGIKVDSPPFRISRTLNKRVELLQAKINESGSFVISGSLWDWGSTFTPLFNLAVFITAPTSIRVERLEKREHARYGERILKGGDMYNNHRNFIEWAKTYDTDNLDRSLKLHEDWICTLSCPVLRIDGMLPVDENVARIKRAIKISL